MSLFNRVRKRQRYYRKQRLRAILTVLVSLVCVAVVERLKRTLPINVARYLGR